METVKFKEIIKLLPENCQVEIVVDKYKIACSIDDRSIYKKYYDYRVLKVGAYVPKQSIVYMVKLGSKILSASQQEPKGSHALIKLKDVIRIIQRRDSLKQNHNVVFVDDKDRNKFFTDAKTCNGEKGKTYEISALVNKELHDKWLEKFQR